MRTATTFEHTTGKRQGERSLATLAEAVDFLQMTGLSGYLGMVSFGLKPLIDAKADQEHLDD